VLIHQQFNELKFCAGFQEVARTDVFWLRAMLR